MPRFVETPIIQITDIRENKMLNNLVDKFMFDDENYVYIIAHVDSNFTTKNENAITMSPNQQMSDLMEKYSHESYRLLAM